MKGGEKMKSLFKKASLVLGLFAISAGIAVAVFLITVPASTGNSVKSASAGISVESGTFDLTGLNAGGTSAPVDLSIENTGESSGTIFLNVVNTSGALCPDLKLVVSGDALGTLDPIANGSLNLGTLAAGATKEFDQVVMMEASSTQQNTTCTWDTTVTISG